MYDCVSGKTINIIFCLQSYLTQNMICCNKNIADSGKLITWITDKMFIALNVRFFLVQTFFTLVVNEKSSNIYPV